MLLGFYARFVSKIESGIKPFTLRNKPKRMPKIGETLHMYTGGYNDTRKLITREHSLMSYQDARLKITLLRNSSKRYLIKGWKLEIWIDNRLLTPEETAYFHILDGFDCESDFIQYHTKWKVDVDAENLVMFHWTDFKY